MNLLYYEITLQGTNPMDQNEILSDAVLTISNGMVPKDSNNEQPKNEFEYVVDPGYTNTTESLADREHREQEYDSKQIISNSYITNMVVPVLSVILLCTVVIFLIYRHPKTKIMDEREHLGNKIEMKDMDNPIDSVEKMSSGSWGKSSKNSISCSSGVNNQVFTCR